MVNSNRKMGSSDLATRGQRVTDKAHPLTLQELKKLRKPLRNINIEHKKV